MAAEVSFVTLGGNPPSTVAPVLRGELEFSQHLAQQERNSFKPLELHQGDNKDSWKSLISRRPTLTRRVSDVLQSRLKDEGRISCCSEDGARTREVDTHMYLESERNIGEQTVFHVGTIYAGIYLKTPMLIEPCRTSCLVRSLQHSHTRTPHPIHSVLSFHLITSSLPPWMWDTLQSEECSPGERRHRSQLSLCGEGFPSILLPSLSILSHSLSLNLPTPPPSITSIHLV